MSSSCAASSPSARPASAQRSNHPRASGARSASNPSATFRSASAGNSSHATSSAYRLERDIDVDRDGPVGPRPHRRDENREQLIERIRGLRADRGLSIQAPGLELGADGPELDLGV